MDKLVANRVELFDSEDECNNKLISDINGFKSPPPSDLLDEEEESLKETHTPLLVSVTRSGKRRVMELQERPRARRCNKPRMLLSSDAVTRIRRVAQHSSGGPESPIEL